MFYDEINVNKGLRERNRKLNKKIKKRQEVKEHQVGVVRFIVFENQRTAKINGRLTYVGKENLYGLQIENKLFYEKDGKLRYVYINKKNCKVLKKFHEVPEWASPLLIEEYDKNNQES